MNRLTHDERRRVFQAQQRARETMLAQLTAPSASAVAHLSEERARWRLLKAIVIAALLGGGFLVSQALDFHPPASLIEALLPRL